MIDFLELDLTVREGIIEQVLNKIPVETIGRHNLTPIDLQDVLESFAKLN